MEIKKSEIYKREYGVKIRLGNWSCHHFKYINFARGHKYLVYIQRVNYIVYIQRVNNILI